MRRIKLLPFHPDRRARTLITMVYTLVALAVNFFFLQVFCMPVWWTAIPLVLFIISLILFPYAGSGLKTVLAFFLGTGIFICVYSVIFLADPWENYAGYVVYIVGILLLGLGLLPFIFVYYLYHIYRYFIASHWAARLMMLAGLLLPIIVTVIYLAPFQQKLEAFKTACGTGGDHNMDYRYEMALPQLLEADMYTEQFVGIGLKYHTKLDYEFDGWRPPMHNPLLNIGLWLYSNTYYPRRYLNRPKYYKHYFPDRSYKVSCPCSYSYDGRQYLNNFRWH